MTVAEGERIYRIAAGKTALPVYGHPNGWRICKRKRDWSLGGITRGAQHQWQPRTWYEISRRSQAPSLAHVVESFQTLREAREWCDEHKASA